MALKIFLVVILNICIQISSGQDTECPTEGIAYLPHPDCTLYIVCVNGIGTLTECPRPLYYNPRQQRCDFPENVPECMGGTRPPGSTSTTTQEPTEEPTEEPTLPPPPPPDTLTECGQTITASSGTIQYKLGQTYDTNELCTFIVRTQNFTTTTFILELHGISELDPDAIVILPFIDTVLMDAVHMGPPNNPRTQHVDGYVFVVIFNPKTSLGTGFKLTFKGVPGDHAYNYEGLDFVYNNSSDSPLTVPFWSEFYGRHQYNIFVLSSEAKLITDPNFQLQLTLSEDFLPDSCSDKFYIYQFQRQNAEYAGTFCNEEVQRTDYETKGLFIIGFYKFYDSYNATGTLAWEKVPV
ncbi:putative chitinase 3 [Orchesella cincta]|uniref:Putative chitinase 3 n=1 Tax=Orchesella cincta TaxID=48709 RepID=A0A1D2N8Z3_ORCCI|nr:putative chitinase 3 [Orchesella cincta]